VKKPLSFFFIVFAFALTISPLDAEENVKKSSFAEEVMKAAGIENWPGVTRVKFTFNVDVDGQRKVSATHDWDVRGGKDTVKWGDVTATADVRNPRKNEGQAAEAYKRWVNDSYWLLAPLKRADEGVNVKNDGTKSIMGENLPTLELSFGSVGLTSNDRYVLYIDPSTGLLKYWDYMPDENTRKTATWEEYVQSGGLNLSTRHLMGNALITISGLEVIVD